MSYVVTSLADSGPGTLRDAMKQINNLPKAPPGNFPVIDCTGIAGTITLASGLLTARPLTILGPGEDKLTIDGQGKYRGFFVYFHDANEAPNDPPLPTDMVEIDDLTIANGYVAAGYGGGGCFSRLTAVCFDGVCFDHCGSALEGGGHSQLDGPVEFNDCMFKGCSANKGGAIAIGAHPNANLNLIGSACTFDSCTVKTYGAAIFCNTQVAGKGCSVPNSTFTNCVAPAGNGVIWVSKLCDILDTSGSTFTPPLPGGDVVRSKY